LLGGAGYTVTWNGQLFRDLASVVTKGKKKRKKAKGEGRKRTEDAVKV
jgi:hypothetical protein